MCQFYKKFLSPADLTVRMTEVKCTMHNAPESPQTTTCRPTIPPVHGTPVSTKPVPCAKRLGATWVYGIAEEVVKQSYTFT